MKHVLVCLQVLSPYSAEDCKGLLKSAIRDPNPGTVILIESSPVLYCSTGSLMEDGDSLKLCVAKEEMNVI